MREIIIPDGKIFILNFFLNKLLSPDKSGILFFFPLKKKRYSG
jgi:hypothetical protein